MKLTRKQIAVIVVALVVVVAVVVTVVLLVGKKSKHSAPTPAPTPAPAPTPIPVPTGPIPSGTLSVGWYDRGAVRDCYNIRNIKNLSAPSIILNLTTDNPPTLNMTMPYNQPATLQFTVTLLGLYNPKNSDDLSLAILLVELPDDKNLIKELESRYSYSGTNIKVNPSRMYLLSFFSEDVEHNGGDSFNMQYSTVYFSPVSTVFQPNNICTIPDGPTGPSTFLASMQPIQYYTDIMDRLNKTLG